MSQNHASTSTCHDLSRRPPAGDDHPRPAITLGLFPLQTTLCPYTWPPQEPYAPGPALPQTLQLTSNRHKAAPSSSATSCLGFSDVEQPSRTHASLTSEKSAPEGLSLTCITRKMLGICRQTLDQC